MLLSGPPVASQICLQAGAVAVCMQVTPENEAFDRKKQGTTHGISFSHYHPQQAAPSPPLTHPRYPCVFGRLLSPPGTKTYGCTWSTSLKTPLATASPEVRHISRYCLNAILHKRHVFSAHHRQGCTVVCVFLAMPVGHVPSNHGYGRVDPSPHRFAPSNSLVLFVLDRISRCADLSANDGGPHAWDEGWAFYTGSIEGTDVGGSADGGQMVYALAEKRCENFGTCDADGVSAVNTELLELWHVGQDHLLAGDCDQAAGVVSDIVPHMAVPLIQGVLRCVCMNSSFILLRG